jgi:hypothetical protein
MESTAQQETQAQGIRMTLFLIWWWQAIITGVTLAVIPFEIVHDAIEDELERRGVALD